MARCHDGVIEPIYRDMAPDMDETANAAQISATVRGLLQRQTALTFGTALPGETSPLL